MTLLDIQNQIAEESGQISWAYMKRNSGTHNLDIMWTQVAERYAQEKMKGLYTESQLRASLKATLEKAAENGICDSKWDENECEYYYQVDKSSITDESNFVICDSVKIE